MKNIIEIKNLTKDYGDGKGVFNINLAVEHGESMGFLGSNGAGKTTTLRHLMGFIKPNSGTVRINNLNCFKYASKVQKNVGYLPGETALIGNLTGAQFLNFMAGMKGVHNAKRTKALTERFDLDLKANVRKMSKGTRQKLAIICAFFHDPSVYLLDEPTSGLDPLMQNSFIELVNEEKKRGKTILMSSHIFEEVAKTCDRTTIIKNGKIMGIYSPNDLTKNISRTYQVSFEHKADAISFAENWGKGAQISDNMAILKLKGSADAFIKEIAKYNVVNLENTAIASEELFLQFYENDDKTREGK